MYLYGCEVQGDGDCSVIQQPNSLGVKTVCESSQVKSQSVYYRIHQISSAQRNSYDLAANIYAVDGIQQVTKITYTKITYNTITYNI